MKKLKFWIVLILIVIMAVFLLWLLVFKKDKKDELLLYGNIEIREVNLSFRVSGRLKELYFEEGD